MAYTPWSRDGRTLYIQFKCYRCGKEHFEKYDTCRSSDENDYINTFYRFHTPMGWGQLRYDFQILCPECNEEYEKFIEAGRPKI